MHPRTHTKTQFGHRYFSVNSPPVQLASQSFRHHPPHDPPRAVFGVNPPYDTKVVDLKQKELHYYKVPNVNHIKLPLVKRKTKIL